MPRNGSGVFSLPEPPFVSGTVISSTAMNADLSDIASALTGSVATDGQSPMSGPLRAFAGTLAAPGMTWAIDVDTGRYHPSANAMADVCGGTAVAEYTGSGVNFPLGASIAGAPIAATPVGGIIKWTTNTAPTKWLLCDGSPVSRSTYALLFAVIGTTYGEGDGSTTFNVPNLIGRVGVGRDASGSVLSGASTLGTALGAQSITLTESQIPSHTHTASVTDPGHTHSLNNATQVVRDAVGGNYSGANFGQSTTITANAAVTGISVTNSPTGGGSSHSNVQPSLVVNYIIYAGV